MKLLVVAAHADDEILLAGGTLARWPENGGEAYVAIVCGTARVNIGDPNYEATKHEELAAAMALLKTSFECHGFADQKLDTVPLVELATSLEKTIAKIQPQIVISHFPGDVNQDHRRVAEAVLIACRATPGSPVQRIEAGYVSSSTDWGSPLQGFVPTVFRVLEEKHVKAKLQAMRCYQSELRPAPHPRSEAGIRAVLSDYGARVSATYAEPFVLLRSVE